MTEYHNFVLDLFSLNPLDILIAGISFVVGALTSKKKRGLGLFLQISLLLIRITKHYFDTHPEAQHVAQKYKLEVDDLYHKNHPHHHTGAAG